MRNAAPLFPLLLAAAGCAAAAGVADPPLAQLARWRTASRGAIAAEPVAAPCPAGNPACSRLHALRAEACLGEAFAARAPGAACPASRAAPLLDCAAENYTAALGVAAPAPPAIHAAAIADVRPATPALRAAAAGSVQTATPTAYAAGSGARSAALAPSAAGSADAPPGTPAPSAAAAGSAPRLHAGLAQALLCRAELDGPERAASRAAAAAAAAERAPPDLAALHGARAALLLARVGPAPGRCAAARRARALAAAAPVEHRARLEADALLHLRTCEAPPR